MSVLASLMYWVWLSSTDNEWSDEGWRRMALISLCSHGYMPPEWRAIAVY